mmetsp:Transcript_18737/g.38416  ORF Transcript_18737/g.38416 Transcript_18737/m.38416 type:complete len:81 (+) Transcript_18737:1751-1993(+)
MGRAIGQTSIMTTFTIGTILLAYSIFRGPMNIALGRISPKIKTNVTDSITETTGDTRASKNNGSASFAIEFRSKSVTRSI